MPPSGSQPRQWLRNFSPSISLPTRRDISHALPARRPARRISSLMLLFIAHRHQRARRVVKEYRPRRHFDCPPVARGGLCDVPAPVTALAASLISLRPPPTARAIVDKAPITQDAELRKFASRLVSTRTSLMPRLGFSQKNTSHAYRPFLYWPYGPASAESTAAIETRLAASWRSANYFLRWCHDFLAAPRLYLSRLSSFASPTPFAYAGQRHAAATRRKYAQAHRRMARHAITAPRSRSPPRRPPSPMTIAGRAAILTSQEEIADVEARDYSLRMPMPASTFLMICCFRVFCQYCANSPLRPA